MANDALVASRGKEKNDSEHQRPYELDEDALGTVSLADGGIYRIGRGKKYLYQSQWQGDPNVYFDTSDNSTSPTDAIYLWKFNIVDPYQITIQSKSTAYFDYYLSAKAGSLSDIRLRSPLSTAKDNKVWSFGLLNGTTSGTYQLIVTDRHFNRVDPGCGKT